VSIVRLSGITSTDRNEAIPAVERAIADAGGWIDDATFFSNIAFTVRCVIPTSDSARLAARLQDVSLGIDLGPLSAHEHEPGQAEMTVSINLTFVHHDPDVRQHVPAVPG
jgi:hypothetical protein